MNMALRDSTKTAKLIPIVLDDSAAYRCPYQSWYRFTTCTIRTCKNHTEKTKSCCLAIDRKAPVGSKAISDAELHLFKFTNEDVSTRCVSTKRKRAVSQVKCMIALYGYLSYLRSKYEGSRESSKEYRDPRIGVAESRYPLKIPRLRFKNWMWKLMLSQKEYDAFAESGGGGECREFELHEVLALRKEQLEALRQVVASVTTP